MTRILKVPATITQEQADCVGCDIATYVRIVAVASLMVPQDGLTVPYPGDLGPRDPGYIPSIDG